MTKDVKAVASNLSSALDQRDSDTPCHITHTGPRECTHNWVKIYILMSILHTLIVTTNLSPNGHTPISAKGHIYSEIEISWVLLDYT